MSESWAATEEQKNERSTPSQTPLAPAGARAHCPAQPLTTRQSSAACQRALNRSAPARARPALSVRGRLVFLYACGEAFFGCSTHSTSFFQRNGRSIWPGECKD
ncbi:hypothetical protein HPB50_002351 [Hyalomma asiaticum]|uniref:Uncharacterized protein n=1 Tax=Hyalomma asiaticum TaxID=266040 RepID=A0ACB7TAR5_HYAAI|nr:hypothetical protein HPB50_002351 [Hyalomma asiaticum]